MLAQVLSDDLRSEYAQYDLGAFLFQSWTTFEETGPCPGKVGLVSDPESAVCLDSEGSARKVNSL